MLRYYIMKHEGGERPAARLVGGGFTWQHRTPQCVLASLLPLLPHPGLYLDVDTECWREGSDMLAGADLVFQVSLFWVERASVCGTVLVWQGW